MARTLEEKTRNELIKTIEWRRRLAGNYDRKLEDLSDEELRDVIRILDVTGGKELGGIWAERARHLVGLGIMPREAWSLLDEMVEQLCVIAISKYHGRDEVAIDQLDAIYKLIFFTFFGVEKDTIKEIAGATTSAWKARGLRIRTLTIAFSQVVEPIKKGEYSEMFKPNARVRLADRDIYGKLKIYQRAEALFPPGRKTTTLLQLAVKQTLEELNADGGCAFSEESLSDDYRRTEKWLRGLSQYRMGEFFAEQEEKNKDLWPGRAFPYLC